MAEFHLANIIVHADSLSHHLVWVTLEQNRLIVIIISNSTSECCEKTCQIKEGEIKIGVWVRKEPAALRAFPALWNDLRLIKPILNLYFNYNVVCYICVHNIIQWFILCPYLCVTPALCHRSTWHLPRRRRGGNPWHRRLWSTTHSRPESTVHSKKGNEGHYFCTNQKHEF